MIAAGIGLVVQNTLMVRITQTSSTILIAMLLNSLVGIVLFVSILWFKTRHGGVLANWCPACAGGHLYPACWIVFVFASISGYQNVGAATTIAVLVASQLIGDLMLISSAVMAYHYGRCSAQFVAQFYLCGWRLVGNQTLILIRDGAAFG